MPSTIAQLSELTAVAVNDYLHILDSSDVINPDKKISVTNLQINLLQKSGTPVAGRVASWASASSIVDSNVAVVDIGLLSMGQTYTGLNTFSPGLNFGSSPQSTLNWYEEGTWTPALTFGGLAAGMTYSNQQGYFTRIGNTVHAWATFGLSNVGTSTGTAAIGGLPYPLVNAANFRPAVSLYAATMTYTGTLQAVLVNNSTALSMNANSNGTITNLTQTAFAASSLIGITAVYRV